MTEKLASLGIRGPGGPPGKRVPILEVPTEKIHATMTSWRDLRHAARGKGFNTKREDACISTALTGAKMVADYCLTRRETVIGLMPNLAATLRQDFRFA